MERLFVVMVVHDFSLAPISRRDKGDRAYEAGNLQPKTLSNL